MGQDRFEERFDFLGRARQFGLQARDLFLRLITLDVPFEDDLAGQRLDRFRISLVAQRVANDRIQDLDRGFRQPLLDGILNLLPLGVTRGGPQSRRKGQYSRQ